MFMCMYKTCLFYPLKAMLCHLATCSCLFQFLLQHHYYNMEDEILGICLVLLVTKLLCCNTCAINLCFLLAIFFIISAKIWIFCFPSYPTWFCHITPDQYFHCFQFVTLDLSNDPWFTTVCQYASNKYFNKHFSEIVITE